MKRQEIKKPLYDNTDVFLVANESSQGKLQLINGLTDILVVPFLTAEESETLPYKINFNDLSLPAP